MSQQVPATRMNLTLYKTKQVAAKKGFDLLKSKADALKVRFRDICKLIYDTKVGLGDQSSTAFFSLTQAEYAAGNFRNKVLESNAQASVRVSSKTDNVAGVKLPVFKQYDTGREVQDNLGLAAGGRKISVCREKFGDYLQALIKLASLQTSFVAMDEALKITNRRVNALENVTIPRIVAIIDNINRELDELEREDFTRLKVVKRKKEEALKLEEKEREEELKAEKAAFIAQAIQEANSSNAPVPPKPPVEHAHENHEAALVDVSGLSLNDADITTEKDKKKKKKKKDNKEAPPSALAAFDTADDADVIFK